MYMKAHIFFRNKPNSCKISHKFCHVSNDVSREVKENGNKQEFPFS